MREHFRLMIEFRNGKLKIDSKRSVLEILLDIFIVAMLTVLLAFNEQTEGQNYAYYFTFFAVIGLTFLVNILDRPTVSVKLPTIWYGIFIVLCALSSVWALYDLNLSLRYISRMVQVLLVCYCITLYIKTREDFDRFTALFTAAVMIMIASVFIRTQPSAWFSGFLGRIGNENVTGNNINTIAYICVVAAAISFCKAYYYKKRAYYLCTAFELLYIVLSSSRKALFIVAFLLFAMLIFYVNKRFYLLRLVLIIAAVIGIGIAFLKVPALYNAAGFRLEKMFNYVVNNDTTADGSLALRKGFAEISSQIFYSHPIIGIGLANNAYQINQVYGITVYAHNNYLELASGLGIVGLITYYWYYIYLLIGLGRRAYRGERLCVTMFLLLAATAVGETTLISYYDYNVQIMLTLCFCAMKLKDEKKKTYMNLE